MSETYYHLCMKAGPGCAPIMACGVHLRGHEEGSWDWFAEWKLHTHSYGSARAPTEHVEPRCPRCLESDFYGMCVLGDL